MISSKPRSGGLAQLARAPALQAGGHRFDSDILHNKEKKFFQTRDVIQGCKAGGSIGSRPTHLHLSGGSHPEASERRRGDGDQG